MGFFELNLQQSSIPPNLDATEEETVKTIANICSYGGRVEKFRKDGDNAEVDKSVYNISMNSPCNGVEGSKELILKIEEKLDRLLEKAGKVVAGPPV